MKSAVRTKSVQTVDVASSTIIAKSVRSAIAIDLNAKLSDRQREVLESIATGATNREIADAMYVSTTTAERHVEDMRRKLGARNRAHAVAIGFKEGILK